MLFMRVPIADEFGNHMLVRRGKAMTNLANALKAACKASIQFGLAELTDEKMHVVACYRAGSEVGRLQ